MHLRRLPRLLPGTFLSTRERFAWCCPQVPRFADFAAIWIICQKTERKTAGRLGCRKGSAHSCLIIGDMGKDESRASRLPPIALAARLLCSAPLLGAVRMAAALDGIRQARVSGPDNA